ncbi:uncharacterized protein SETTUDRAFT_168707 [Exserohilum turcica Et28A]|uniref:Uncharacterized protein n=1 Tax=Exserohilum turcicum (strain 28A) TaxID=671987 RepID=R0ITB4_EXST2|nr:uncharacterized protein SETTUDRAFT_168707 [Exserohilum turcica Et28A]EOA87896.1 hypothetical protein SETTUDRAFT_168707 [Exserohilum turcica Et28A]
MDTRALHACSIHRLGVSPPPQRTAHVAIPSARARSFGSQFDTVTRHEHVRSEKKRVLLVVEFRKVLGFRGSELLGSQLVDCTADRYARDHGCLAAYLDDTSA